MKKTIIKTLKSLQSYNHNYKKEYNAFFKRHPELKKEEVTRLALIAFAMFSYILWTSLEL